MWLQFRRNSPYGHHLCSCFRAAFGKWHPLCFSVPFLSFVDVLVGAYAAMLHHSEIMLRSHFALLRCFHYPSESLLFVLNDTVSKKHIHCLEIELCFGKSLLCGSHAPLDRLSCIQGNTLSDKVHLSELVLRFRMSLFCSLPEPLGCSFVILWYASSRFETLSDPELSIGVAFICREIPDDVQSLLQFRPLSVPQVVHSSLNGNELSIH